MKPKITKLWYTCSACPSQWEAEADDGHFYYFRYRRDKLCVEKSNVPTKRLDLSNSTIILTKTNIVGEPMAGVMNLTELQEHTTEILDWSIYELQ